MSSSRSSAGGPCRQHHPRARPVPVSCKETMSHCQRCTVFTPLNIITAPEPQSTVPPRSVQTRVARTGLARKIASIDKGKRTRFMPSQTGIARGPCPSSLLTRYRSTGPTFGPVCRRRFQVSATLTAARRAEANVPTFRNSFVASCHSFVMVLGAGLAKARMAAKMTKATPTPMAV